MEDASSIAGAVKQFTAALQQFQGGEVHEYPISDLMRDGCSANWAQWERKTGVYIFIQDGKVRYVGRAMPGTGLGSRVYDQCRSFGDSRWDAVIRDPATRVRVIAMGCDEGFIASALEAYLISALKPDFNKRCQ